MTVMSDPRAYRISEVAERTGVSIDTLRYYERSGLLDVAREDNGHRRYTERDLGRVVFIGKLRAADVPINVLQQYFALVAAGPHTEPERLALLERHRQSLRDRVDQLEGALAMIEYKIERYGGTLTACATSEVVR
jgi:DNA-binding transcriptional MerR regulator